MIVRDVAGFSLIELIVVLLIMSTIMAVSAPRLTGRSASAQLQAAASDIQTLAVAARSKAILHNYPVALIIDDDAQRLQLVRADDYAGDPASAARLSRSRDIVKGLAITINSEHSNIVFSPDGSASNAQVRIENSRGLSLILAVSAPLGRLVIEDEP